MSAPDLASCYRVLELPDGAPEGEVRRAYRLLVNVWHPDRFEHDPALRRAAEEKLKTINEAFRQLRAVGFKAPVVKEDTPRQPPSATIPSRSRQPRHPSLSSLLTSAQRHASGARWAEAITALTRAAELYPTSYMAWHDLAWACSNGGRLEAADQATWRVISLDPYRRETADLLQFRNGWCSTEVSARATEFYRERLLDEPTNAILWEGLGYLLYATVEDKAAARDALSRAVELQPDGGDAWFRLGLCLRPEEATLRDACSRNLQRLGRGGDAAMLRSPVPIGARLRQWFGR